MKFIIHFDLPSGESDSVVIEGSTIDELRELAAKEVSSRGGIDPWSQEIEG